MYSKEAFQSSRYLVLLQIVSECMCDREREREKYCLIQQNVGRCGEVFSTTFCYNNICKILQRERARDIEVLSSATKGWKLRRTVIAHVLLQSKSERSIVCNKRKEDVQNHNNSRPGRIREQYGRQIDRQKEFFMYVRVYVFVYERERDARFVLNSLKFQFFQNIFNLIALLSIPS